MKSGILKALRLLTALIPFADDAIAETIVLTTDRAIHAERITISEGKVSLFGDPQNPQANLADVLWIDFAQRPREESPRAWLCLRDGRRLAGDTISITPGTFTLRSSVEREVVVSAEDVEAVYFNTSRPEVGEPPDNGVRILSANGDVLNAPTVELTEAGAVVDLNPDVDPILIPRDRLTGIVWPASPKNFASQNIVELRTGERHIGGISALDENSLSLKAPSGTMTLARRHLAAIRANGVRLLPAESVLTLPSPSLERPTWRRNRNALGGPLRLGDRLFAQGLGGRAPLELEIPIPAGARWFVARAGVDGDAASFAKLSMEFLLDGRSALKLENLRPNESPRGMEIATTDARTMKWRLTPVGDDPTGCLGNLVDAYFVVRSDDVKVTE